MTTSALLAALLAVALGDAAREMRVVMGTTAEIRVAGAADARRALDAAFEALDRVDRTMSLYHDSELTRLNDAGRLALSADVREVVRAALAIAAASGGAFDPTVEPLVRASGAFEGVARAVTETERRTLLRHVGHRRVTLDADGVATLLPGTRLDLGGIAKGYAADLALGALRSAQASAALVDLGSSSIGSFGEDVTIDIRDPETLGAPWGTFVLRDASVSTSADSERKNHILDPRTGRPVHRVLSATVVTARGVEADALSTAVYVLGARRGLRLLRERRAEGFVLERRGSRRRIRVTPRFAVAHRLRPAPGVEVSR